MFAKASSSGQATPTPGGGNFPGFCTGTGKPVQLSAAALARAKSIFKNEDLTFELTTPQCSPVVNEENEESAFNEKGSEQKDTQDEEGRMSPILTKQQQVPKKSFQTNGNPSPFGNTATTSTPISRNTDRTRRGGCTLSRMFGSVRSILPKEKLQSPEPSPKRTKLDDSELGLATELANDLVADEEKCLLLGDDSFFMSKSMLPSLVSASVVLCRENGRLAQLNAMKDKSRMVRPTEGFLKKFRQLHKHNRVKLGKHTDLALPRQYSREELLQSYCVKESVADVNSETASSFMFDGTEFFSKDVILNNTDGIQIEDDIVLILTFDCVLGVKEFASTFMSSPTVDPSLISMEWIRNHYKWIVWTLASYEAKFPDQFGARALTPENVLLRLKYRYDREIDGSERSAIRRITEQDDNPGKRMVLFVSDIYEERIYWPEPQSSSGSEDRSCDGKPDEPVAHLELSDGWYSIDCICDSVFLSFVKKGLVTIGTKLIMHGAELTTTEAVHPLEAKGKVFLKIQSNCVRRAKWNCRLGFCDTPFPFPILINSILPNGGLIPLLHVTIARVYPVLYHCKVDGKSVFYSQKHFDKIQRERDSNKERQMEKIFAEVTNEYEKNQKKKNVKFTKPLSRDKLEQMSSEQLLDMMESSEDSASIQMMLSKNKLEQVRTAQQRRTEEIRSTIEAKVQERLSSLSKNFDCNPVPFVKLRLLDVSTTAANVRDSRHCAILSIWKPQEELLNSLSEGLSFKVFSLLPSNFDNNSSKRISASRSTKLVPLPPRDAEILELIQRRHYNLNSIMEEEFDPIFGEFDTVGLIVYISPSMPTGQTIYITDEKSNILAIRLWSSITSQGLDDVLLLHNFVFASNLSWRPSSRKSSIPTAYCQEFTTFTGHPKETSSKHILEELKTNIGQDFIKYAESCELIVYRMLSSRPSTSRTPATPGPLTSIVSTTPTTVVKETTTVHNNKTQLLNKIGSPPKLLSLPLRTSSRLSNKFQVPRKINSETG